MPRAVPAELVDFLAPFSDEVQQLAVGLRARVFTVMPNAHEVVWDATNAVSLAYTPTTRWQDGVVHIAGCGADMGDRGTTVRVSAGPKRRPG